MLDKAIKYGKEYRKPYYKKAQQCDRTCRPNGGCEWCVSNRKHQENKKLLSAKEELKEWSNENN